MSEAKKITIPILLILLSGAFLLASFMVYISRGNSGRWIARKMKLGGLMLSLTAILSACDPVQTASLIDSNPPWTCYMVAYNGEDPKFANRFYIETEHDSLITLNPESSNVIKGEIRNRTCDTFSFAVFDLKDSVMQQENIMPNDGKYDENTEGFEIKIDKDLREGDYKIRFFLTDKDTQPEWSDQYFNLRID